MSIVNEAEYAWRRHVVTVPVGTTAFEAPVKIYAARGEGTLWLDSEATTAVSVFPVAVDEITVTGAEMTLIGEAGQTRPVESTFLNTAEGMTKSELTRSASEVITLPFSITWNGAQYTEITLYGNGRIYINGVNAIRVHAYWLASYMGATNGLYTQSGTSKGRQFFKIRFDGHCYYSSQTDANRSIWELFFFDDGSIFINSVRCPTSSTSNYFYINSASQIFTVNKGGGQYIIATSADSGVTWMFEYPPGAESTTLFLIRKEGVMYTVTEGALTSVEETALTAGVFLEHGFEDLSTFMPEGEYSLLCWSAGTAPTVTVEVTGSPQPQALTCTVDMSHESISGIQQLAAEYSGTVELCHRVTDGEWTTPVMLGDWVAQDKAALYASLGEDKLLYLKFWLYGGAALSSFKITFIN